MFHLGSLGNSLEKFALVSVNKRWDEETRIIIPSAIDSCDSEVSHESSFHVAVHKNGLVLSWIIAIDFIALLEAEFALGDVDDGDRDGTGSACFNGVVGRDDLELRDGVEGEGSWASGGEIVHG